MSALTTPPLGEPYDLLAVVALALVSYGWAVRSGFRTGQLDRALAEECPPAPNRPVADVVNPHSGG
ncbi:hypothetical protein [Streptomyces sp. BRA346]|uniref:hypothetical protein n=1 Tax=Streptomyces sp. BRA346 TaxID=2878199 RepID=UPI0040645494